MGLKVVLTSRDWFFGSFHVSSPVRPVSFSGLRDPRPRRSFTCSRGSWARFSLITSVHAGSRVRKSGSRDTSVFVHGSPRAKPKTPDFASRTCVQPRSVRSLSADSATPVRRARLRVPVVPGPVLASLQVCRLVRGSVLVGFPRHLRFRPKTPDFASRTCVQPWSVRSLVEDSATPVRGGCLRVPVLPWLVLACISRVHPWSGSRVSANPPFSATGALTRRQKQRILPPERVSCHGPSGHFCPAPALWPWRGGRGTHSAWHNPSYFVVRK